MSIELENIKVGPISTNCYIVSSQGECILIDPGDNAAGIRALLGDRVPLCIVLTHGHWDHREAVCDLVDIYHIPVLIGGDDVEIVSDPAHCGRFGHPGKVIPVDGTLSEGDVVTVGDATFKVLHTPGHTPGGICLYDVADKVLFSGDTVFAGTVGRTDLGGGSTQDIARSAARIAKLPDDVAIYPGHEGSTTVGRERRVNPYFQVRDDEGRREDDTI